MKFFETLFRHIRELQRGVTAWAPAAESPLPAEELDALMRRAAVPSRGFFFMLILSTAIATFGLLSNSAPAIIGAMIIAPLMAPILGLAYGIVVVDGYQIGHSIVTVVTGAAAVVLFAFLCTNIIGLRIAGPEILDRTSPTLLDLGIAMCAGAAGAYAYSRKSIANSIAGVAIAVALVPPLAVTGVGLAMNRRATADVGLSFSEIGLYSGGDGIAYGAFLLFLTNLAGIVVVAGTVLVFQRYGKWKQAALGLAIIATAATTLMEPLGQSLHRLSVKSRAMRMMATLPAVRPDLFDGSGRLEAVHVTYRDGVLHIGIDGILPRNKVETLQESTDLFRDYMAESLGEPVVVEVEAIPLDSFHVVSGRSQ